MTLLSEYYVPGLHIEDRSIKVPLDWTGHEPGHGFDGESISLFYRVVTAPEHVHDDLPLLVFLQGGPGGSGPRPLGPSSDGWIEEAIKHFRVVLPDQRGTGRSSRVDTHVIEGMDGDGKAGAAFLKRFLADSIVRDFEHLRRTEFGGARWVTLGQSYGGFLTLTYLSLFPQGVIASFTTGGIPHVPADATDVYRHTFPRMAAKTKQFYERYPIDIERAATVADILRSRKVTLPNGDGSASTSTELSDEFLSSVMDATSSRPLYWPLQEFIYANGELKTPIRWAAQRVRCEHPEFAGDIRPLNFTGEAMFPWMFEQERALRPFKPAMDVLMEDTHFGTIYDADQLARNEVPLQAAVYFDDMYVDSGLQLDTLSRVGRSHYWTTNEFEHDGVHGSTVFRHLFTEALNRGDLAELF